MSVIEDGAVCKGGRRKKLGTACAVLVAVLLACALTALCACSGDDDQTQGTSASSTSASSDKVQTFSPSESSASTTLKIASGSENREAADAIQKAVDSSGVAVEMHYMGSLDIMGELEDGGGDYDAVWPASSIWVSMGDTDHVVQDLSSTSTTPIVFGVKKSKAVELGWADESGSTKSVSTADIIKAVKAGKLSFSMTSATQSNSGASAYLAFLTALSGSDGPITKKDLSDSKLKASVKELLSGVDRSSGSSDWLKDMVVEAPDSHDAMVNYESLVIAADKELEAAGKEPLVAIYPSDGIAISDSPLGYVDRGQGDDCKSAFDSFQSALGSDECKLLLEKAGRRCGLGGKVSNADDEEVKQAFRADWGIDASADALKAITLPKADVIRTALRLYQTELRKPSYTVWVVDYSGSMYGDGKKGVVKGLEEALDPKLSAEAMVQPTDKDVNVFIPFSSDVVDVTTAQGTDTDKILSDSKRISASGGTDIYAGLEEALGYAKTAEKKGSYTVAIVLMTDGRSMEDMRDTFYEDYQKTGTDTPIFSIMFGDADPEQLNELADLSNGKVFDGRSEDLASVFRQVKGYN